MDEKKIIEELEIDQDVINIYPYGSRVYGTNHKDSDHDFIIVTRNGILDSGAFRDNAISSEDGLIQGVLYSRGGFQDAINNYQIGALECIFLNEDLVIKQKWPFKLRKIVNRDLAKSIIKQASNKLHTGKHKYKDGNIAKSKKEVFHALRTLDFGLQLKEHNKIKDFSHANELYKTIQADEEFNPKNYLELFNEMRLELKE